SLRILVGFAVKIHRGTRSWQLDSFLSVQISNTDEEYDPFDLDHMALDPTTETC
ncbi:hypothetical protein A2U01_0094541, partial [Trifolium medium]|nr:hypothetical protein [Trifolium medium]